MPKTLSQKYYNFIKGIINAFYVAFTGEQKPKADSDDPPGLGELEGRYHLNNFEGKLKQLPGAIVIYTAPTQTDVSYAAFGWMADGSVIKHADDFCERLNALHRLKRPPPQIKLGAAKRAPLAGAEANIPAPSDHLRDLGRAAFAKVVRPALEATFRGLWRSKMCNSGARGSTTAEARSWTVVDSASCGCGGSCSDGRLALGYPPSLPLVDMNHFSANNTENKALDDYAKECSPDFAAWLAEQEEKPKAKVAAKAASK